VTSKIRLFAAVMLVALSSGSSYAGSLKIVAVGASNTWGWGVSAKDTFAARLQVLLRERGIDATVTNAGVIANTTTDMLNRIDIAVPVGTNIAIVQPGSNDLRFGRSTQQRAATIVAIVNRLRDRRIRVIVYDPIIPPNLLQWDGIHFTAEAHDQIAKTLAARITSAH
jgi:acyl-CoA thioesterase-1